MSASKDIKNSLRFEFINARSICNKLNLVSNYLLSADDLDLLFITESWLNSNYTDAMCCPAGFNILRCDRVRGRGGGVAVFYKSELHIIRVDVILPPDSCYELICIDLYSYSNLLCRFCCVYLPPALEEPVRVINTLCASLGNLLLANKPVYLFGDYNLPNIDWSTSTSTGDFSQYFLNFCSSFSLSQLIDVSTHDKGNILDLLLCNYNAKEILLHTKVTSPPWSTDHFMISSSIVLNEQCTHNNNRVTSPYPNFKLGNYDKIRKIILETNWDFLSSSNSLQSSYDHFCDILTSIISNHIPLTSPRSRKRKKQPRNIRQLLAKKHNLYKRSKSDSSFKNAYKQAAKDYDSAVNRWHDSLEANLCRDPSHKKLYGHINSKLKAKRTIPPIEDDSQNLVFTDVEKANVFNATFQKFFTVDNNSPFSAPPAKHQMPSFQILPDDILKACSKLKKKLTRTPEGIPTLFLSNTINSLLYPLTILFNLFLSLGFVPWQWKTGLVIPVFKKGDRRKVGNYRPISLTSSISRLFEEVLLLKLIPFTLEKNLLSRSQFGFLPNRTSCGNLLSSVHSWMAAYSSANCTSVLYTDIKKAFDSVNHRFLVHILHSLGFHSEVINWIAAFLSDRQQQVCINNSTSTPLKVLSGVPQGSVLGPFIFLVYFDRITNIATSLPSVNIRLFADDSKIFSTNPQDLQHAINTSEEWLFQHQLALAPAKCAILKIKKNSVQENSTFFIKNHSIAEVSKFKDLGVLVSNDLTWSDHIDSIFHKASSTSFQIIKSFNSRNIWTWLKIYNTYIRPKVEFNTPIWSPHLQQDIDKIENIQRRFTKFAFNKCNIPYTSYEDRLRQIGYLSLRQRRKYFDLILMYKMINNISDLNFNDYFTLKSSSYCLRSHPLQIKPIKDFKCPQWTNSFFGRIPSLWNVLPSLLVNSSSLNSFKINLKDHILGHQSQNQS